MRSPPIGIAKLFEVFIMNIQYMYSVMYMQTNLNNVLPNIWFYHSDLTWPTLCQLALTPFQTPAVQYKILDLLLRALGLIHKELGLVLT